MLEFIGKGHEGMRINPAGADSAFRQEKKSEP